MEEKHFSVTDLAIESLRFSIGYWKELSLLYLPAAIVVFFIVWLPLLLFTPLAPIFFLLSLLFLFVKSAFEVHDNVSISFSKIVGSFVLLPRFFLASILFYFPLILIFLIRTRTYPFIFNFSFSGVFQLFLWCAAIFIFIRLCFSFHYILDKEYGIIESFKKSFELTQGMEKNILSVYGASIFLLVVPFFGIFAYQIMWVRVYRKFVPEF